MLAAALALAPAGTARADNTFSDADWVNTLNPSLPGANEVVNAVAADGRGNVYAGGDFGAIGTARANYIAKWDGSTWSALGSGLSGGWASDLAADGAGHLFVGGKFIVAGTNVSPYIAQANVGSGVAGGQFGPLVFSPLTGFSCTFRDATPGQPYRIQTSPSLADGSWTDSTNFTYSGPITITNTSATAAPKNFYRAVSP